MSTDKTGKDGEVDQELDVDEPAGEGDGLSPIEAMVNDGEDLFAGDEDGADR
jgi:hypothetical protein